MDIDRHKAEAFDAESIALEKQHADQIDEINRATRERLRDLKEQERIDALARERRLNRDIDPTLLGFKAERAQMGAGWMQAIVILQVIILLVILYLCAR